MLFKMAASFFKVGCIGFGGGSALIPIIENEIVENGRYLSEQTYTEHTVVANITPGALPVKLGALAGYHSCGISGMLACSTMVALPGTVITILFIALLSQLGESAVHQITLASVGISVFIIYLLLEYIQKVLREAADANFFRFAVFLTLFSFIVTSGKEIRELFALLFGEVPLWSGPPVLDLSTIDLLKLAFFVIFFTGGKIKSWRMIAASAVTAAFLYFFGDASPFPDSSAKFWIQLLMLALSIIFVIYDSVHGSAQKPKRPDWKSFALQLTAWGCFVALCCLPAFFLFEKTVGFVRDGALSTITSFGGGEAYLSVADGMFVASGAVPPTVFYGQTVPIANALPGPILVKILSGIGYTVGFEQGSPAGGFALALAGFGIAVGTTSAVCMLVNLIYTCFTDLTAFRVLKRWILPVVCGLLLSVIVSMLCEMLKVTGGVGINGGVSLIGAAALFLLVKLLAHRFRMNDVLVIAVAGGLSVLLLNCVNLIPLSPI